MNNHFNEFTNDKKATKSNRKIVTDSKIKSLLSRNLLNESYKKKAEHILTDHENKIFIVCKVDKYLTTLFDFLEFSKKQNAEEYFSSLRDEVTLPEPVMPIHSAKTNVLDDNNFMITAL